MNPLRPILWGLGLLLFVVGAYMLYFEAGLSRWISIGVLTAGLVLVAGLIVMSFASSTPEHTETVVRDRPVERPVHREVAETERPVGEPAYAHHTGTHDRPHEGTTRSDRTSRTHHDH